MSGVFRRRWAGWYSQPRRVGPYGAAAGTDQTISVPAGVLHLTGLAPTVVATDHQTIEVPAGVLNLVGLAPTVAFNAHQTISVPAGVLHLTGLAPTVVATDHQTIAVPAGVLNLVGLAPTVMVNAHQTIAVPAGVLHLVGVAPSVLVTDHQTISVPAGVLNLAGLAPTVATYTPTMAAPDADTTAGAWLPSAGSDLYAMIDETVADDADYIYTESASTCRISLGTMTDPAVNYGHAVTYRINGDGAATVAVRIGAGATTAAEWTHAPAPGALTTYTQYLSSAEVDAFRAAGGYLAGWLEFEAS